jgi:hypothetical protein
MIVSCPALTPRTIPESESTVAAAALFDRQRTALDDPDGSPQVGAFAVS